MTILEIMLIWFGWLLSGMITLYVCEKDIDKDYYFTGMTVATIYLILGPIIAIVRTWQWAKRRLSLKKKIASYKEYFQIINIEEN